MDSSFNLAVHALVCLSHSGRSLSSEALAENICTNPTRVRRVMAGLKKAGMGETREGLDGGYRLQADPTKLTLRQVAEAVNTRFVDCAWHSGDIDRDCAICSGMAGGMDALYRNMNEECAAYLAQITITDIETQLFTQKQEDFMMLTITTNSFENDVLHADKPVLVDFWAQWCPYCRRIAPAFDKVGEQYADTLISGKINYDEEPQLIQRFGIDTIPTLMLFKDGEALGSIVAPASKAAIETFIQETLAQ